MRVKLLIMNDACGVCISRGRILKAAVFSLGSFPKLLIDSVEAERRCRIYEGGIEILVLLEDLLELA